MNVKSAYKITNTVSSTNKQASIKIRNLKIDSEGNPEQQIVFFFFF